MEKKIGVIIIVLLLCFSVFVVSAKEMIGSEIRISSDGASDQTVQPDVSNIDRPTCVPEFPVLAVPLAMIVGLFGAAFMLRRQ